MTSVHQKSDSFSGSVDKNLARSSIDSRGSDDGSPLTQHNGHSLPNGDNASDDSADPVERLQRELERAREEKETLATQYRNLLAKLTQMRTTLGNKLQQDAVSIYCLEILDQILYSI